MNQNQFGFRKGYSTQMALTKLIDKITDAMDKGNHVLGVFPNREVQWHSGGEQKITFPMAFAVLATHLASGHHSSLGEARWTIKPALSSPALSDLFGA